MFMGKISNLEEFIKKSKEIHGEKYDYSKVEYINSLTKVCIICPIHGEFWQIPKIHIKNSECPKCAKIKRAENKTYTTAKFIKKSKEVHEEKYDYNKVNYVDCDTKVCIICPIHGIFWQIPSYHLYGNGCPQCGFKTISKKLSLTKETFIERAKEVHGDEYDYSKVIYVNAITKICITCSIHGDFWQTPSNHLNGHKCSKCSNNFLDKDYFIEKANLAHNIKYDYSNVSYGGNKKKVCIICPIHGEFYQRPNDHLMNHGCPECAQEQTTSSSEQEILNFIKENYNNTIIHNNRTILDNNFELDIYLPDISLAFEYDGLYWHNENKKPDLKYHLNKTINCESKNIKLIHIFEDEWIYKKEIVKSRILNLLHKTTNIIFARKCIIKNVSYKECEIFLNQNHIQGNCMSKYRFGLYYNNCLCSVMTFGLQRKNLNQKSVDGVFELIRFANSCNTITVGGADKLLQHFIGKVKPKEIISYADRRWSKGELYNKLGFSFVHDSQPNYFYVIGDKRENRFKYRKDLLIKEGYDSSKSEHQIMLDRKIYRIYDCGCKVYKMIF